MVWNHVLGTPDGTEAMLWRCIDLLELMERWATSADDPGAARGETTAGAGGIALLARILQATLLEVIEDLPPGGTTTEKEER